jgi:hypothetical protein
MTAAVAGLLAASLLVSASGLAIAGAEGAASAQLQTLVLAAQTSRSYASTLVSKAASNALDVASEQALLASGDNFLAEAQADLSTSTNLAAGIQDARVAMQDYTGAAIGSSLLLENAGPTTSVDLAAVADAETEVNATVALVSKLVTQACESITVNSANATLFRQSCADAKSGIVNATLAVGEAVSFVAQARVDPSSSVDISQAYTALAEARGDVNASAVELATISSFTYYQRGETYYRTVLLDLYSAANSSVGAQQAASANLTGIQNSFTANVKALTDLAAKVLTLDSAVEQPWPLALNVSSSAAASESVAAEVSSNLTSLLGIAAGLVGSGSLISAINTAQKATSAYSNSVATANSTSAGYTSASIPSFAGYLAGLDTDKQTSRSAGLTFVSDYASVGVQLEALIKTLGILAPQALLNANSTLTTLEGKVSTTTGSLNEVLTTETQAMSSFDGAVNATIAAFGAASGVSVNSSTVQAMKALAQNEAVYLNATALETVDSAATSIPSQANSTAEFIEQLNASLSGTVLHYIGSINLLAGTEASVGSGATATASALAGAVAVVRADSSARANALTAAKGEVTLALSFFSNLQVSAGVSAMLDAGADFRTASATY